MSMADLDLLKLDVQGIMNLFRDAYIIVRIAK